MIKAGLGLGEQQCASRHGLMYHRPPMSTRYLYPFWNRENWLPLAYGTVPSNQQEPSSATRLLGQNQVRTQTECVAYTVPDGFSAYVTVTITTAVFGFTGSDGLTVDLSVVNPDGLNPTAPQHYIFFDIPFASHEVRVITLPLDAGATIRIKGQCTFSVFGVELPAAS